jgi:choline dehydrogenase
MSSGGRDPLVAELPVGEGLTDHVGTGAAWEPTERLHRETQAFERDHPLLMASVTVRKRSRSCAPGVQRSLLLPGSRAGLRDQRSRLRDEAALARVGAADRARAGRAARDRPWVPAGPARRRGSRRGIRSALRELVAGDHAGRYAAAELRRARRSTRPRTSAQQARGFFHPVGTCALGTVVDERCRVLGFENLYVVDASVMPTIPRAMTHLSTIAIAERAAEWI